MSTSRETVFACVYKTGKTYNPEYVRKLMNGAARGLQGQDYRFVCLTDDPAVDFCETIPLLHGWRGWWSKMELFRPGIYDGARVIFLDLDAVIIKDFSELLTVPDKITMLRAFHPNKTRTSSMMVFIGGAYPYLYEDFKADPNLKGGDADHIYRELRAMGVNPRAIQRTTKVVSYKRHCRKKGLPAKAQVVMFHGRPRPHKVKDKWMKEYWV